MKKAILIIILCLYSLNAFACWGCCNNGHRISAINRLKDIQYEFPSTYQFEYRKRLELLKKEIEILLEKIWTIEREEGYNDKFGTAPPLVFNFDGTITEDYGWIVESQEAIKRQEKIRGEYED